MKIEHIAIWVRDLEVIRDFYEKYFGARHNDLYHNPLKGFRSFFLTFDGGARIELMNREGITEAKNKEETIGLAHFALSLGSREAVDEMTEKIRQDGLKIVSEPRTTGDGYYESVIADPEGNLIELTV